MSGGGSFTSDQKVAHLAVDGQLVTGRCRITSLQASGAATSIVKLYDGTGTGGTLIGTWLFGTEGLDYYFPGSGVLFKDGCYLDLTTTPGVTVTYT